MNVVTFDSDAPLSERQCYVGTSNYRAGQLCHELVCEALPEGGKVAVFLSNLTKNNMIERKAGYEEAEEKSAKNGNGESDSSWKTVEYMVDEGDLENTKKKIQLALEAHEDIKCMVGLNGYHGPILLEALKRSRKTRRDQTRGVRRSR